MTLMRNLSDIKRSGGMSDAEGRQISEVVKNQAELRVRARRTESREGKGSRSRNMCSRSRYQNPRD